MTTEPLLDSGLFRRVCGQFPTGVTAVTAVTGDGRLAALTANSFTSVSLDPAKVLFCLANSSSSFGLLTAAERIAIHILSSDQEDVARRFATSGLTGEERLEGTRAAPGPGGVPLLPETPAVLSGPPDEIITSGDHAIILVAVDHVHLEPADSPALAFYQGRFTNLAGTTAE